MSPYRSPEPPRAVNRPSARFAFPLARVRLGADRFELSFWNPEPLLCGLSVIAYGFGTPLLLLWALPWDQLLAGGAALLVLILGSRTGLHVDREGSWVRSTVLGLGWRRLPTGRSPAVGLDGWGADEIAVVPSEEALRPRLHDGDRAVLHDAFGDYSEAQAADAARIIALAREEIARLHA